MIASLFLIFLSVIVKSLEFNKNAMEIGEFHSVHDRLMRAKLNQEQQTARQQARMEAWESMQEQTNKVAEEILADAEMPRAFGLENKSVDDVSKMMRIDTVPYAKDEIPKMVDEVVDKNFRLHAGHLGHKYKLKEMLVRALENDTALNKYFDLISELLANQ